jgi:D-tyrosyl-tRNA(Tyr) deacylase
MRALVQRADGARVEVDGRVVGQVGQGLVVLLGIHATDDSRDAQWIAHRLPNLRIFSDAQGRMNRSVLQVLESQGVASGVGVLVVPNFTLCASTGKGHRPGFDQAMPPDRARTLFDEVVAGVAALGVPVATGVFGAHMRVTLTNDGPVTLLLDSAEHRPR